MAVFQVGAATASTSYCAVCGAANAKATEPKIVPKAGLSEGPSAEQGVQVCDAGGLKNTPVLVLLPLLVIRCAASFGTGWKSSAKARALFVWVMQSPEWVPHGLPPLASGM